MKLQEMNSDELLREFLLKPNNNAIWRMLKHAIVNEAILATINIDGTTDKGISNHLLFGLYGIVRLRRSPAEDHHEQQHGCEDKINGQEYVDRDRGDRQQQAGQKDDCGLCKQNAPAHGIDSLRVVA